MTYDPRICAPEEKLDLETNNNAAQIDFLTSLVVGERAATQISESHIQGLQHLAVQGIYPCGGRYRDASIDISISNSAHKPPPAVEVPGHVRELVDYLNRTRGTLPALERAAYAIWRLNWIHPFKGGNGRTARCLAYLVICMDLEGMVPGVPTLPTLIYNTRGQYVEALKAADAAWAAAQAADDALHEDQRDENLRPDLSAMVTYLQDLVTRQMASAIQHLVSPTH